MRVQSTLATLGLLLLVGSCWGQNCDATDVIFYASFDQGVDADLAKGDSSLYTAPSLARKSFDKGLHTDAVERREAGGKFGGCLQFLRKSKEVVLFKGRGNIGYSKEPYSSTISFWMKLDPAKDLPPGYVDPLQVTDKTWNDASIFVDFTQENPRDFRLGVFSDLKFWNSDGKKIDDIPDSDRPLVPVRKPPFSADRWTHIAICLENINGEGDAGSELFIDGVSQGKLNQPQRFTWDLDQVVIMLGIYYVGGIDEFAVFNRKLNQNEIDSIAKSKGRLIELPQ